MEPDRYGTWTHMDSDTKGPWHIHGCIPSPDSYLIYLMLGIMARTVLSLAQDIVFHFVVISRHPKCFPNT
jgi:hypothetical protein